MGAKLYSDTALLDLALVPDKGIDKAILITDVSRTFSIRERTATKYINGAGRQHLQRIGSESLRCALLTFTPTPRKDIYPGEPPNRDVIWVSPRKPVMQTR
jgi:hypothetical protein